VYVELPLSGHLRAPLRKLRPLRDRPLQSPLRLLHAEEEYAWLPRSDILTFEETARIIDVFADLGVDKGTADGGRAAPPKNLAHL